MNQIFGAIIGLVVFWAMTQGIYNGSTNNIGVKHQFTTAMIGENPADKINKISKDASTLYLYIKYDDLSLFGRYESVCKIYDVKGTKIYEVPYKFLASSSEWFVGCWVVPAKLASGPDKWTFEVELNGNKMFNSEIEVTNL